jgi:hypothetical protein
MMQSCKNALNDAKYVMEQFAGRVVGHAVTFPYIAGTMCAILLTFIAAELYVAHLGKKNKGLHRLHDLVEAKEASNRIAHPAEAPASMTLTRPFAKPAKPARGSSIKSLASNISPSAAGGGGGGVSNTNTQTISTPTKLINFNTGKNSNTPGASTSKMNKVDQFLQKLAGPGLLCKRQKVAGTPPPARGKCFKIKSNGLLYFYSETFKVKRTLYGDETWDLRDLCSACEGDPYLGEVYLDFKNKYTLKHTILRLCFDETRDRRNCITNFEIISQHMQTHPEWILKNVREYVNGTTSSESNNNSPRGPLTPQANASYTMVTPVTNGSSNSIVRSISLPDGVIDHSPRMRSPPRTPIPDTGNGDVEYHPEPQTYSVNYKTNFHEWLTKELLLLIKHENLEHHIKLHRERLDLIQVLETHYRKKSNKPIVNVSRNFIEQLKAIYSKYNPEKITEIPKMSVHFEGKEKYLLEQILERYEVPDEDLFLFGVDCGDQHYGSMGSELADR